MVERQLRRRGIRDERVLAAMGHVPRELFVPEPLREHAYADGALSIGFHQTISQPYVVAAMAELVGLDGDERVLDVGAGSGYAAAVLAELAQEVVSIERIPELTGRAREALAAAGHRVDVRVGDGTLGRRSGAVPCNLRRRCRAGDPAGAVRPARRRRAARAAARVAPRTTTRPRGQDEEGPAERASVPCRFVPLVGRQGFEA